MEARQVVMSCPEILEVILKMVPVSDLVKCAEVNWTWNKEAVKILDQKAIVKLDLNGGKVSSYVDMIRGGGRCFGNLVFNCFGENSTRPPHLPQDITNEQFQDILSVMEVFGLSRVKVLMLKLRLRNGLRTPQDYQQIFTKAQNVEVLVLNDNWKDELAATTLSCFPEGISFDYLKHLSVRFVPGFNEQRIVVRKLVGIFPNVTKLSGYYDDTVGMFLDEMGRTPGRLENIVSIDTVPSYRVPAVLLQQDVANLKAVSFQIISSNCENVVAILGKYKDTLVEMRLSLMDGGGGEVTLPKSMDKLERIDVHFMSEDKGPTNYPILKFPIMEPNNGSHDDASVFYPNLTKLKMDGNREPGLLSRYLALVFPGEYRSRWIKNQKFYRMPKSWSNSKFTLVRSLDLSSEKEDWGVIMGDEKTRRRLMHYFPNANFGSAQMVHSSEDEWNSEGWDSD